MRNYGFLFKLPKISRDLTIFFDSPAPSSQERGCPTTPSLLHKEGSTAFSKPFFSLRKLAALDKVQASLALLSIA